MLQVLTAGIAKTNGHLYNLTKTTALTSQTRFIEACSLAELEITSGAFDYNTAIRHAVDYAVEQGTMVEYASGARRSLESAVRTAVMTGVSQTTGEISLANARELGTDLMEISAHGGARPSHAEWQGQIVSVSGDSRDYLTLSDIGYGTIEGFKGINCRHDWWLFIEGVSTRAYTDEQLKDYRDETVEYNGQEMSVFDASQRQRAMERQMKETRRRAAGYDEAAKNAIDKKKKEDLETSFFDCAQKLGRQRDSYKDFCKQTGLPSQLDRAYAREFNRSLSQKSVFGAKKAKEYDTLLSVETSTGVTVNEVGVHIRSRAIVREISIEDIKGALTSPLDTGKIRSDRSQQFIGEKATVAINVDTGKLTTVWPTKSKKAENLKKNKEGV